MHHVCALAPTHSAGRIDTGIPYAAGRARVSAALPGVRLSARMPYKRAGPAQAIANACAGGQPVKHLIVEANGLSGLPSNWDVRTSDRLQIRHVRTRSMHHHMGPPARMLFSPACEGPPRGRRLRRDALILWVLAESSGCCGAAASGMNLCQGAHD